MVMVEIVDIHPKDAYYEDRKELIGKRYSDKHLYPSFIKRWWKRRKLNPWKGGRLGYRLFFAVKVKKVSEE